MRRLSRSEYNSRCWRFQPSLLFWSSSIVPRSERISDCVAVELLRHFDHALVRALDALSACRGRSA